MQGRRRSRNYRKKYNYYHKINHTIDESYSKHGYPPWIKQRYKLDVNKLRTKTKPYQLVEEDKLQLNHVKSKQNTKYL